MSNRLVPVVVVAGHPALGLATSTTGGLLADALHTHGGFDVHYVGRGFGPADHELPYRTVRVEPDEGDAYGERTVPRVVRELVERHGNAERVVVITMGPLRTTHSVVRRLTLAGLREHIVAIGHIPVEAAPLPEDAVRMVRELDVAVPFSRFAHRAITAAAGARDVPQLTQPIAAPVESAYRPLNGAARLVARRALVDAEDGEFIVGTFARNVGAKQLGMVLHLVRLLARGEYGRCVQCGAITSDRFDAVDFSTTPEIECRSCGGALERAVPRPDVRAYLHTQTLDPDERRQVEGYDVDGLVQRHDIGDVVRVDRSLAHGIGVPAEEVARRMASCDVHLVPFAGSAWELPVMQTAACGVPNVVTDYAGPAEYAAPFSIMLQPTSWRVHPTGVLLAQVALDDALDALDRLLRDQLLRQRLGNAGREVASAHGVDRYAARWIELLTGLERRQIAAVGTDRADRS